MKKLIRLFMLFIVISFIIGVGGAFNGQSTVEPNDEQIKAVEKI